MNKIIINEKSERASNKSKGMRPDVRVKYINSIALMLIKGEIKQGLALKTLRIKVLDLKQEQFSKIVKVSRRTISEVENDRGNYSCEVINKLFKPFGLKLGLIPSSTNNLENLLNKQESSNN